MGEPGMDIFDGSQVIMRHDIGTYDLRAFMIWWEINSWTGLLGLCVWCFLCFELRIRSGRQPPEFGCHRTVKNNLVESSTCTLHMWLDVYIIQLDNLQMGTWVVRDYIPWPGPAGLGCVSPPSTEQWRSIDQNYRSYHNRTPSRKVEST